MSHKGIRKLIEDVSKSLGDDIQFDYGRDSDFNLLDDKRYPFVSASPLVAIPTFAVDNTSNFMKTWRSQIAFYQIDQAASDQTEYAKILDEMDSLVDNFINKLNTYSFGACIDSDVIILTNFNQQPFIKVTKDIVTGWIITFDIQVTDQFNYCGLGC